MADIDKNKHICIFINRAICFKPRMTWATVDRTNIDCCEWQSYVIAYWQQSGSLTISLIVIGVCRQVVTERWPTTTQGTTLWHDKAPADMLRHLLTYVMLRYDKATLIRTHANYCWHVSSFIPISKQALKTCHK